MEDMYLKTARPVEKRIATEGTVEKMLEDNFTSMLSGDEKEEHLKKDFTPFFKEIIAKIHKDLGMKSKSLQAFIAETNKKHSKTRINMLDRFKAKKKELLGT